MVGVGTRDVRSKARSSRLRCGAIVAAFSAGLAYTSVAAGAIVFSQLGPIAPGGSPFGSTPGGASCQQAASQLGTNYPGSQVEPSVAMDPGDSRRSVAAWQQDRWSTGGSNALLTSYSSDSGHTWTVPAISAQPRFSYCTGGAGDTGGYSRAADPWVTIAPNGDVYMSALAGDSGQTTIANEAILVAKSTDHGATWSPPTILRRDTAFNVVNDKESITADRYDAHFVYATWDRLVGPNGNAPGPAGRAIGYRGPTWFSRTTDGGGSWEAAHIIYDPGEVDQTIGNQVVQLGDGTLVDGFDLIRNHDNAQDQRGFNIAVIRSANRGATWSSPSVVATIVPGFVRDPTTGAPVRTSDVIPEIAADPTPGSRTLYMTWQDARFGSAGSSIALSRSNDGGVTWSAPAAVNTHLATPAFLPAISVGSDGAVNVGYDDLRSATGSTPLETDIWLLRSLDGGGSWAETHAGGSFDLSTAPLAGGYFVGDYQGLAVSIDPSSGGPLIEMVSGEADGTAAGRGSHVHTSVGS